MNEYHLKAIIASTFCFSNLTYAMEDSTKESLPLKMSQTFKLPTGKDYDDLENIRLSNILPNDVSPDTFRAITRDPSKMNDLGGRKDFKEGLKKPQPSLNWQGITCVRGMGITYSGIGGPEEGYAKDLVRIAYTNEFMAPEGDKIIYREILMSRFKRKEATLNDYPQKHVLFLEFNTRGTFNKEYINDDRDSFGLNLIFPNGTHLFMENEAGLKEEILLGTTFFSESLPNTYFSIFDSRDLKIKEVSSEKIRKINFITTQFSYQTP